MDDVSSELRAINKTLEKMLDRMDKPKRGLSSALEMAVLVVGALSVLHLVEIVRQWIIGG